MSTNYTKHLSTSTTPQRERARADQAMNAAGGYVFTIDPWGKLDRFLVLGSEGGSYYASERKLTLDNAKSVTSCLDADGPRVVARVVEISKAGRAPKNDAAIFVLAMASGHKDPATRKAALVAVASVCRTGTHLFQFARDASSFRRWGRGLRGAVARWYNDMPPSKLAYQVTKYAQRDGWSHRDLLRLAHPTPSSAAHNAVFRWVAGTADQAGTEALTASTKKAGPVAREDLPTMLVAFEELKAATNPAHVVRLVREHRFTHEMLPTQFKSEVSVWEALLHEMPLTALIRNLGKMTEVGLLKPLGTNTEKAVAKITNGARLHEARLHPLGILGALKVYEQGHGERGKLTWSPVPAIVDALNEAFYMAFQTVSPTGKSHLLALDVSGSMTYGSIAGMPGVTPRIASAAMAMMTARTEKRFHVVGFSDKLVALDVSPSKRLDETIRTIDRVTMGSTDCAQPMIFARERKLEVDTFVVYTDNETWFGSVHPYQALLKYREAMSRDAKLVVVGMTATDFTIADPNDPGMLDVVGFDAAAPAIMADFARS